VPVGAAYIYIDDVSLVPTTPCNVTATSASLDNDVKVFPNPTHSEVHFSVPNGSESELKLLDVAGKTLIKREFRSEVSLDLSQFPSGLFFYQVTGADGSIKSGRLIKE
jgi:hypothetical protein